MNLKPVEALFTPRTIAVVGAARAAGKVGHSLLRNLIACSQDAIIYPVNPNAEEVLGHRAFPTVAAIERPIDLALVAVPAANVDQVVSDALRAPVRAIAIVSAGFREAGEEGAALEAQIADRCARAGVALLGPNCYGVLNAHSGLNASPARELPPPGGVSIISQSGAICTALLDWGVSSGIGIAKVVGTGNQAGLSEVELLHFLAHDPQTRAIACYLEFIKDGNAFVKAAEAVTDIKPVVVLRAGTTSPGRRAVQTHTGSLAGEDVAYGAAFKRAGVVRAESFEALCDAALVLSTQPLPRGKRIVVISNAGGPGVIAADAAAQAGLRMDLLTPATTNLIAKYLPDRAFVSNPVDLRGDAPPERYASAFEAVLADERADAAVVLLTPHGITDPGGVARALAGVPREKPAIAAFLGGRNVFPARQELSAAGLATLASPERAITALRALVDYAEWRRRPPRVIRRFAVNRHRVERLIQRHHRAGAAHIGEVDAKEILRAYDFHVPHGAIARTSQEAVEIAARIGFPVAMKITSPGIVHKTDAGGVQLDLVNRQQVNDAFELMMVRVHHRAPDARLEGVYIEQMCERGVEVIIGMKRDPNFGPMLMFGLGGILVETMRDVSFYLAPITEAEALEMLAQTRSYELLAGARGGQKIDTLTIAQALQRLSQLATDFPQIEELDVNPLIVYPHGETAIVADARILINGGRA